MTEAPRALIFDMDGLLMDTEGVYKRSWTAAAGDLGFDLTDELYLELIGITVADCEQRLQAAFGETFPLDRFREEARERYEQLIAKEGIPMKPGVADVLAWTKARDIPCGVGTSTVTDEARSRLQHHGVLEAFVAVIGGDQVSRGKPDPEIFLKVADALKCSPQHCLVFEDAHSGVHAARAGGMNVVLIPDLLPATDEIRKNCTAVFGSLSKAAEWLESLPMNQN